MYSFLDGIDSHIRLMPDFRPRGLVEIIKPKCYVIYFPVELPLAITHLDRYLAHEYMCEESEKFHNSGNSKGKYSTPEANCSLTVSRPLHIVWPHRW